MKNEKIKEELKKGFKERVYSILKRVPKGKAITYKRLAELAGNPRAARAVGSLMKKNIRPDRIPCYKVIKSNGKVGGYSAKGGIKRKLSLLSKEGIRIINGKIDREFLFE